MSPEVRAVLGIKGDVTQLPPNELLSAILKAPVDLLWNGGIGTYVKAASETHAEVGDRANNALRVNGAELRCKVVGEGGNLGMTQKGRIEAAHHGVLLNTDFIDNSAGVDTSDHEVNIKILLGDAVQRGELDDEARNEQLRVMTDEVGQLVLWDNYRQNQAITLMEHQSIKRLGSMAHFIRTLEGEGLLDRQVENLPTDAELTERKTRGQGLTRPELSVLLSYDKIKLFQQLLESDVPEDPYLSKELVRYFPEPLHEKYAAHMQRHRLKREIIATAVTNSTINRMGATFMMRMQEDTGHGPAAIAKAYTAAREILDARELWAQIEAARQQGGREHADRRDPADLGPAAPHDPLAAQSPGRHAGHRGQRRALPGPRERAAPGACPRHSPIPVAAISNPARRNGKAWTFLPNWRCAWRACPNCVPRWTWWRWPSRAVRRSPRSPACSTSWARRWTWNGCATRSRRCRWKATGMRRRVARCWTSSTTSIVRWPCRCLSLAGDRTDVVAGAGLAGAGRRHAQVHAHHAGGNPGPERGLPDRLGSRPSAGPAGAGAGGLSSASRRPRACLERVRDRTGSCSARSQRVAVCSLAKLAGSFASRALSMRFAFVASETTVAQQARRKLVDHYGDVDAGGGRGDRGARR